MVLSEDLAGKDCWERINVLAAAIVSVFEPIEAVAMPPEEWERGESLIVDFADRGKIVYG